MLPAHTHCHPAGSMAGYGGTPSFHDWAEGKAAAEADVRARKAAAAAAEAEMREAKRKTGKDAFKVWLADKAYREKATRVRAVQRSATQP